MPAGTFFASSGSGQLSAATSYAVGYAFVPLYYAFKHVGRVRSLFGRLRLRRIALAVFCGGGAVGWLFFGIVRAPLHGGGGGVVAAQSLQ